MRPTEGDRVLQERITAGLAERRRGRAWPRRTEPRPPKPEPAAKREPLSPEVRAERRAVARLEKLYRLTSAELEAMTLAQAGRCAICCDVPERGLVIDHDHSSGRVRGLLCNPCNTAIGLLREDPVRLAAAISYVSGSVS